MKNAILFDPSYGTSNLGDFIINAAIMKQMEPVFKQYFLLRYSTHTPVLHGYQNIRQNLIRANCQTAALKFLGGTNLFKYNLLVLTPDWNINIFTKSLYKGSISLGCGVAQNSSKVNLYTRYIYQSILSKKHIHSVRDEKTKNFLNNLGFQAINTGCPTMWGLTKSFCETIPHNKASNVVFTLTDYDKNEIKDQKLIDILLRNYNKVYFWVQGNEDYEYFSKLKNTDNIEIINPSLDAYHNVLQKEDVDYVGTRLHAGVYAMQHSVRSIILIVDNRARDMQDSYNINALERDNIDSLEAMIQSNFATDIKIDEDKIQQWKQQFAENPE